LAGIAGIQGVDDTALSNMLDLFKHRCSQEAEINQQHGISLGSCELNVGQESKAGFHRASDGSRTVILDGRIYNPEIANMTDAEAVLYLYDKFGTHFAKKLDGDFACAISDKGKLILARDAVSVKSLYYGHSDGRLCFASEAKSLVGIADDVKEFPPGYVYSQELGFQKYIPQAVETPNFEDFDQAKKVLAQLLTEATEKNG
jgi:asparagine synthase (glutamine-hydrolysing)